MDFYTLIEHIHHTITVVDVLKQLQTVYKLNLSIIFKVLAATSFEVAVLRFISDSGTYVVVGNDSSYFSHI